MADIKNVLIIGASGNLGPAILQAFLSANKYTITVLSRQESSATFPANVKVFKTDYSETSLKEAFANQDAVVSVIAPSGLGDTQKLIVDVAVSSGVKRFFPSEFGGDTEDHRIADKIPLFAPKVKTNDYLKAKAKEVPGFTWTILATGPFFDWGLKVGFLGLHLPSKTSKIYDSGDVSYSTTTLAKICEAVVASIAPENYEATANKAVYVSSFVTTPNKLQAAVEKATGDTFQVNHVSSEEVYADAMAKYGQGDQGAILDILTSSLFGDGGYGDLSGVPGGLWNERLGLKEENFEEEIGAVVKG